jgi:acetylornithine deacetylase/succinyl-diaminopimelate desuccinylase-like protein
VASEEIGKNWNPDMVVIGEASNLTVKRGQKGRAEIVVETLGKSAHSSNPAAGVNAVKKMSRFLVALEKEFVPPVHPVLGEGILEVTDIVSSPYPGASVIPERCRATFDRRLLIGAGESETGVIAPLLRVFDSLAAEDPDFQARATLAEGREKCYTGADIAAKRFAPGWILDDAHPLVQKVFSGLSSVGQNPTLSHYIFCTNGSWYAGKAGIPTIGYGGSFESLAHVVDEYIELEQLYKACEGYYGIIGAVFA